MPETAHPETQGKEIKGPVIGGRKGDMGKMGRREEAWQEKARHLKAKDLKPERAQAKEVRGKVEVRECPCMDHAGPVEGITFKPFALMEKHGLQVKVDCGGLMDPMTGTTA